VPSGPNRAQRRKTLMARITRTISIRIPTDPQALAALRARLGLSSGPRRNRAMPDRQTPASSQGGFLLFGRCGPNGLNLPFKGDIS
jgi:hypothetical protein